MRTGTGWARGSVGELVQGFTTAGEPFHVTLPATWGARCAVEVRRADDWGVTAPDGKGKAALAAELAARAVPVAPLVVTVLEVDNPIPVGRGCASSTADVLAAMRAVAAACDSPLDDAEQARLAAQVESSDGLAYAGMAAVNHRTGRLLRQLSWTPAFELVVVLPDTATDTASVEFAGKPATGPLFDALLDRLTRAADAHDAAGVAQAATESALLNQAWLPNPLLPRLLENLPDVGALGVAVAHTGTAAAWLFAEGRTAHADAAAEFLRGQLPADVRRLRVAAGD